ncbi:hypothetical protein PL11_005250 [Lentilactobacillus curieae]|uniref:Phage protein n=1 Tax=Lentilactobacillus curieae TaxID=1138822 RepID=A0A1S6QIE7_9LACO|nr:hypothetical protein [Lentilactobacillus curieae]AQW21378.1 hypothetical protein PL11_005250 [Lentilactobacillus curieae]
MMTEQKLRAIVDVYARYNVEIKTDQMKITSINQHEVDFDANTYMQDQLIELIAKVLANQLIKEVFEEEFG